MKNMTEHVTLNLCFCFWGDMWVTYCFPVSPVHETSTHYFSCSYGTGIDLTKSALGQVTPNFCFCIRWDLGVMQCIPLSHGHESLTHYFSCSGGTDMARLQPSKDAPQRPIHQLQRLYVILWSMINQTTRVIPASNRRTSKNKITRN
jgi:hypothetical protein